MLEHGATFLQIREKDLDEGTFEQEAEELKGLCAQYHVPFVVNDSVEIASTLMQTASMWASPILKEEISVP